MGKSLGKCGWPLGFSGKVGVLGLVPVLGIHARSIRRRIVNVGCVVGHWWGCGCGLRVIWDVGGLCGSIRVSDLHLKDICVVLYGEMDVGWAVELKRAGEVVG